MSRLVRTAIKLLGLFIACGAAALPGIAAAEYPERPIRILTPFSAGSVTDVIARTIASNLSESWGQPVVVDKSCASSACRRSRLSSPPAAWRPK
jgi:tripartite-type tricarboxylate transporter receptor subunit TctC